MVDLWLELAWSCLGVFRFTDYGASASASDAMLRVGQVMGDEIGAHFDAWWYHRCDEPWRSDYLNTCSAGSFRGQQHCSG